MRHHDFSTIGRAAASEGANRGSWRFVGPSDHLVTDAGRQSGLPFLRVDGVPARPTAPAAHQLAAKRLLDILLVVCALVTLAPMLLGVAVAVMLTSRGPVLFRQARVGYRGKPFMILKFRTMYVDACDASGISQATQGDRRVTPLGRFLRRTSIDELPQLINVLMGDMSLVGPRPHVAGMLAGGREFDQLVPYYDMRHMMRPGLTGWAQANGLRGPTLDADIAIRRVDHDIAYIQNYSVLLDIKIIFITLWREFLSGKGV